LLPRSLTSIERQSDAWFAGYASFPKHAAARRVTTIAGRYWFAFDAEFL
jgi:hypothetical protein